MSSDQPAAPGSVTSLRTANQRRVISVVQSRAADAPLTQAAIARQTGLAPATVSNIVRDLVAAQILDTTAGSGRRGGEVSISARAGLILGVDIGHSDMRVALSDRAGRIVAEARERLDQSHHHSEALNLLTAMMSALADQAGVKEDSVISIGLGLPTPIDHHGLVNDTSILPGWVGTRPKEVVEARLRRPTFVANDANLGALAEYRLGAGQGESCLAYVKVASGIGCGLVIGGGLFTGGSGMAGELGHLTIDENGPLCRCGGRGCLEAYASAGTVQRMLTDQLPSTDLASVRTAVASGHPAAVRGVQDAGRYLGYGLALLVNLINPTAVVIGGGLALTGNVFLDAIRQGLKQRALSDVSRQLDVRPAALGDRASMVGAVLLASDSTELALPV